MTLEIPPTTFRWLPKEQNKTNGKRIEISQMSEDQSKAFAQIIKWTKSRDNKVCSLAGYAGTGKSSLTALIAEELVLNQKKSVAFLTPTAKAACVLRNKLQTSNLPPSTYIGTVHGFMYIPVTDSKGELLGWKRRYFEKQGDTYVSKNDPNMPKLDLIVVDECSMVPESMEEDILSFGVPILAVGDHGQLPPVIGRSTWMRRPNVRLEKIHRQAADNPVLALATYVRERGNLPPNFSQYSEAEFGVKFMKSVKDMSTPLLEAYDQRGQHEVAVACYTNRVRCILNVGIHTHLFGDLVAAEIPVKDTQLICLKNSDKILVNGMRGFVVSEPELKKPWWTCSVEFPDEGFVFTGPTWMYQYGRASMPKNTDEASELANLSIDKMDDCGAFMDFGYALTVHKLQGSSVEELFIVLEQNCKPKEYSRWLYTAITRASQKLNFVESWI